MTTLDATVLIAHLDSTDALHEQSSELMIELVDHQLTVSPITLAEILVGPVRAGRLTEVQAALAALQVSASPLPRDAPVRLAKLRVETELRLPNCCVLLAAQESAEDLATFDQRLASAADRLGFAVRS